jgi:hypothetical protein
MPITFGGESSPVAASWTIEKKEDNIKMVLSENDYIDRRRIEICSPVVGFDVRSFKFFSSIVNWFI